MTDPDHEIAQLKARVSRLEERLNSLQTPVAHSAPVPMAPPLLTRSAVVAAPEPKGREIPSIFWVAGAGAVIFLIGVIYLFAVSIQMGWISPAVRVLCGLVAAGVLGVFAARLLRGTSRTLGVIILAASVGTWQFSLFYGSHWAFLFSPVLGLLGSIVSTVLAGGLAARIRSGSALAVAVAAGLLAPLVFSDGSGNIPGLFKYLIVFTAAQVAVLYLVRTGARWRGARLLAVAGTWFVVLTGLISSLRLEDAWMVAGLATLLHGILLALLWLPRHPQQPWLAGAGTVMSQICLAFLIWTVMHERLWQTEWFALPLVGLAGVSLALIGPARRRSGGNSHDLTLLMLTVGFAVVAVPVAVDRTWVAITWAVMAILLALGERQLRSAGHPSARGMMVTTLLVAMIATFAWIDAAWIYFYEGRVLFANPGFFSGVLTSIAWWLLMKQQGAARGVCFAIFQFVAVNALAWELWRGLGARRTDGLYDLPVGLLMATFVYALAGAAQWLRGVILPPLDTSAKFLRIAGYCWLGFAGLKLITYDLSGSSFVFRAVAALGMGAMLIVAALWANSHRAATLSKSS